MWPGRQDFKGLGDENILQSLETTGLKKISVDYVYVCLLYFLKFLIQLFKWPFIFDLTLCFTPAFMTRCRQIYLYNSNFNLKLKALP